MDSIHCTHRYRSGKNPYRITAGSVVANNILLLSQANKEVALAVLLALAVKVAMVVNRATALPKAALPVATEPSNLAMVVNNKVLPVKVDLPVSKALVPLRATVLPREDTEGECRPFLLMSCRPWVLWCAFCRSGFVECSRSQGRDSGERNSPFPLLKLPPELVLLWFASLAGSQRSDPSPALFPVFVSPSIVMFSTSWLVCDGFRAQLPACTFARLRFGYRRRLSCQSSWWLPK